MLAGRKDALGLLGLGAGLAAAHPLSAGVASALVGGAALSALGGALIGHGAGGLSHGRLNSALREGFRLRSDPTFPESFGVSGSRFGFTVDDLRPVDIPDDLMPYHTAVIGSSGFGKTTIGESLLLNQVLRGGGFIFIDAKIDIETVNKVAHMARLAGREDDFYVLNIDDPSASHTYNPIMHGDADEVAARLLNLIPSTSSNAGADHYRQSAQSALQVIVGALQASDMLYHVGDLAVLLQSPQALENLLSVVPRDTPEARALEVNLDQYRRRQPGGQGERAIDVNRLKDLLGGMSGRILAFSQGKFGEVFRTYTPEIVLQDIILNNKMLYVTLPTMAKNDPAINLAKMVLSDLRTAVAAVQKVPKYARPSPPFLVFMDEMGSYVIDGLSRLFEQARSAGIALLPAFQSFANLAAISQDMVDMIVQNTTQKVFFRFNSPKSSELAAEILGKCTRYMSNLSVSESESTSANVLRVNPQSNMGAGGSQGETWREVEDYRVTPDRLSALERGEAIVTSGSRVWHVMTPMIGFPDEVPDYRVVRHPAEIPRGKRPARYEDRYEQFLGGVE